MATVPEDVTGAERAWQRGMPPSGPVRVGVYVRRAIIAILFLAALALFIWVLISWLQRPRTQFLSFVAEPLPVLHGPPVALAGREMELFRRAEPGLAYSDPEALTPTFGALQALRLGADDTLIVYVAAHGVSHGESPSFVTHRFDPARRDEGLVDARTLLGAVRRVGAGTIFVIVDAGQLDYDPRLGIVGNEFPGKLKRAVEATGDERLWVLCSHSDYERSHRSRGTSVFGTYVANGLSGAADANGDGTITADELHSFVARHVAAWVEQSTGGTLRQMPALWRGAGAPSEGDARLVAVSRVPAKSRRLDISVLTEPLEADETWPAEPAVADLTRGFLAYVAQPPQEARPAAPSPAANGAPSPAANGGDGQDAPPVDPAVEARRQLRQLLDHGWRIRDELARTTELDGALIRPIDTAPHLWREFQEELIAYEQLLRTPRATISASAVEELKAALSKFWIQGESGPVLVRDLRQVHSPGAARAPVTASRRLDDVRSLALAETLAHNLSPSRRANVQQLRAQLDELIDMYPGELAEKIAELKFTPEFDHYYELRLVKQLAQSEEFEPELFQLALRARSEGERTAAIDLDCAGWIAEEIAAADRLRVAGERQLVDQIGSDWPRRSKELLEQALERYGRAAEMCREVQQAVRLRNDLVFRAPYFARVVGQLRAAEGADRDVAEFLDRLIQFSRLLDQPSPAGMTQIRQLGDVLRTLDARIAVEVARRPREADVWRMSRLLETPFPTASARRMLLRAERDAEIRLMPPREDTIGADGIDLAPRRDVEMKLVELASWGEGPRPPYGDIVSTLEASLQERNFAKFSSRLRWFYERGLRAAIEAAQPPAIPSSPDEAHHAVVRARRALASLDVRDVPRFRNVDADALTADLNIYNTLAWHRQRFLSQQADAFREEWDYLASAADTYRTEARKIFAGPGMGLASEPEIELRAAPELSLVGRPTRELEVTVAARSGGSADVWLIVDYDPDLVEIEPPTGTAVYPQRELPERIQAALDAKETAALVAASEYPYRPDLAALPATWEAVHSGEERTMHIAVRAAARGANAARVIVKAVAAPADASGDGAAAAGDWREVPYVRHTVHVPLRVVDLAIDGPPNSWQEIGDRVVLHSFPNRLTDYSFGVVNNGRGDREVALRFFAPPARVDLSALSQRDLDKLLARMKPVGQLTVQARADGEPHFAHTPADEDVPVAAPEAAADTPKNAAAADEVEPPSGPPLPHGLLVELSDPSDPGQKFIKQVLVVPQRPRRYVLPQVGYNPRLERIEVEVRPRLVGLLPPGPVAVECEIAGDSRSQSQGKLRDVLEAPDYAATLFVNVPAATGQVVTLHLHVDGYPRAFIYRVPCSGYVANVPEVVDRSGLRLEKLEWPDYQPPAAVTPVLAQVDSPVGTFEHGRDRVQVALDERREQRLVPEVGLRLPTDRQVAAYAHAFGDDGVLAVDTRVSDHEIALRTARLQNVHVDVFGQVAAAGTQADAEPITLHIDGAPPRVHHVEIVPWRAYVVAGAELQATVLASDEMSGVHRVEVGFDVDGTGEFSEGAAPVAAVLDPAQYPEDPHAGGVGRAGGRRTPASGRLAGPQRWTARLPTEGLFGVQTLLVRATDRVGNVSDVYTKRVQIITPEEAAAKVQQQPKLIEGVVVFREAGVPAARVTLLAVPEEQDAAAEAKEDAPAPQQVAATMTPANGSFSFTGVPPGKYQLKAEGVINNRPRLGEREVVVELAPGQVIRADLVLE